MKQLAHDDRTDNLKGRQHCHACNNDAVIVVGTHQHIGAAYDEYGPCPFCLRGHRLEYGDQSPWTPDGYWQGRDLDDDLVARWVATQPVTA